MLIGGMFNSKLVDVARNFTVNMSFVSEQLGKTADLFSRARAMLTLTTGYEIKLNRRNEPQLLKSSLILTGVVRASRLSTGYDIKTGVNFTSRVRGCQYPKWFTPAMSKNKIESLYQPWLSGKVVAT